MHRRCPQPVPVFKADEKPDILVCTVLVNRADTDDEANHTADPALERLTKHAAEDPDYHKVWAAVQERRELNLLRHQTTQPRLTKAIGMLWRSNQNFQT